jgi:hypothetical protein
VRIQDRDKSELENDKAGGVVDETFPFENGDDPPGQPQALRDRRGRDRIRRRNDGAEDQAGGEGEGPRFGQEAGNHPMGQVGDRNRGDDDQADGQQQDWPQFPAEIPPRSVEGLDVEERRQEDEENEIGIECELRQIRNEADQKSAEDEKNGIRNGQPSREKPETEDESEEQDKDDCVVHEES